VFTFSLLYCPHCAFVSAALRREQVGDPLPELAYQRPITVVMTCSTSLRLRTRLVPGTQVTKATQRNRTARSRWRRTAAVRFSRGRHLSARLLFTRKARYLGGNEPLDKSC